MSGPILDTTRRDASSGGVSAVRTGGLATLLLLVCQYRGVPIALWLLGVPPDAPEYQNAGVWLAPLLAGLLMGFSAWLGSTARDYVHASPTANFLVRAIAQMLPGVFLFLSIGCATPTYQQTLDSTLRNVTIACELVISPEAAASIPTAKLAAAKQACNIAERAIVSAELSYAAAKLSADPAVRETQTNAADANLAIARAQLAAVLEAQR